jgi:hypothetical protein
MSLPEVWGYAVGFIVLVDPAAGELPRLTVRWRCKQRVQIVVHWYAVWWRCRQGLKFLQLSFFWAPSGGAASKGFTCTNCSSLVRRLAALQERDKNLHM